MHSGEVFGEGGNLNTKLDSVFQQVGDRASTYSGHYSIFESFINNRIQAITLLRRKTLAPIDKVRTTELAAFE